MKADNSYLDKLDIHIIQCRAYWGLGEYKKCEELYEKGEEICSILENKIDLSSRKISLKTLYGELLWIKGELEAAMSAFKEAIQFKSDESLLIEPISNIGAILMYRGALDEAMRYFMDALRIAQEKKDEYYQAISLNNIGAIHWYKGDLEQALDYLDQALANFMQLDNKLYIATASAHIGEIYWRKGYTGRAFTFLEQSKTLSNTLGNSHYEAKAIFYLISLYIDQNNIENAKKLLAQLEQINLKVDNKLIKQECLVAKALVLKTSKRLRKKAEAEDIFKEIVEQKNVIDQQITTIALLNLCHLLIEELKITGGDPEILDEVQDLINRLFVLAKEQNSYSLLVETHFLQGMMALLQFNLTHAKKLMMKAQDLAQEKGLVKLAITISNRYDSLLSQMTQWDKFTDQNITILERMELIELENLVKRMISTKRTDRLEVPEEEPIALLILNENGLCVYSKEFFEEEIKEQLIGGFLTAINNFMRDAFSVTGSIDRIKHQEYTILLNGSKTLLFCYIFKGQSYHAMRKLSDFTKYINSNQAITERFIDVSKTGKLLEENLEQEVGKFAEEMFH